MHIGQEIKKVVKNQGKRAKDLALALSLSESNVYSLYNREVIDIETLIRISMYLNVNFLEYYLNNEPLKSIFLNESAKLRLEIKELTEALVRKNQTIEEQEKLIHVLQQRLHFTDKKG